MELDAIADRKLPMRQQRMREVEEALYFVLDEKGHSVHLTDKGATAMSPGEPTLFIVPDISQEIHDVEHDPDLTPEERITRRREVEAEYAAKSEKLHIIHKLLQAHALYEKDVEYVVQEGQVLIVDEFTGRLMSGRRWSDGLHQAVEAKEGVEVKGETQTLATITIQNYFRMFEKLAGMTGTAETEETEFFQIYGLEVSVIPTNKPIRRDDRQDEIFRTRREKYNAIADEIARLHEQGWPVLIGTVTVDVSETLSRQLKRRGLEARGAERQVPPARGRDRGRSGAGRGDHDRDQHGGPRHRHQTRSRPWTCPCPGRASTSSGPSGTSPAASTGSCAAGPAARAIPGQTIFYLSLEDDLMRLFGSDRIARWMDKSGAEEGEVISHPWVTRAIEQAQKRVELQNFQQRKRLLEYDDVMNQQREVIYSLRLFALERGEELKAEARRMIELALDRTTRNFLADADRPEDFDRQGLASLLLMQYLVSADGVTDAARAPDLEGVVRVAKEEGEHAFQRKLAYLAEFGRQVGDAEVDRRVLSGVMQRVIDEKWKDHLYDLDQLRNAIQYRAYGQRDPLVEYKKEAFEMFEDLVARHPVHLHRAVPQDPDPGRAAPAPAPPPPVTTNRGAGRV